MAIVPKSSSLDCADDEMSTDTTMRSNFLYPFNTPKTLFGTDRGYAALVLGAVFLSGIASMSWYVLAMAISLALILIVMGRQNSRRDPWWYKKLRPYNRFADVYMPVHHYPIRERGGRPYGFARRRK